MKDCNCEIKLLKLKANYNKGITHNAKEVL